MTEAQEKKASTRCSESLAQFMKQAVSTKAIRPAQNPSALDSLNPGASNADRPLSVDSGSGLGDQQYDNVARGIAENGGSEYDDNWRTNTPVRVLKVTPVVQWIGALPTSTLSKKECLPRLTPVLQVLAIWIKTVLIGALQKSTLSRKECLPRLTPVLQVLAIWMKTVLIGALQKSILSRKECLPLTPTSSNPSDNRLEKSLEKNISPSTVTDDSSSPLVSKHLGGHESELYEDILDEFWKDDKDDDSKMYEEEAMDLHRFAELVRLQDASTQDGVGGHEHLQYHKYLNHLITNMHHRGGDAALSNQQKQRLPDFCMSKPSEKQTITILDYFKSLNNEELVEFYRDFELPIIQSLVQVSSPTTPGDDSRASSSPVGEIVTDKRSRATITRVRRANQQTRGRTKGYPQNIPYPLAKALVDAEKRAELQRATNSGQRPPSTKFPHRCGRCVVSYY